MATAAATVAAPPKEALGLGPKQRAVLMTTMLGNFVMMMAISPISNIMPTIQAQLQADVTLAGWVMSIFFLALTSTVLIVGRLGDIYGHSKVFMAGTILFTLTALVAGLSQSIFQLIAVRGVQGVAAAMIVASGFALIGNNIAPNQRGRAVGLITTATGLGGLIGIPLATYAITNLSWRWMFFFMVPLGLLGIVFANKLRKVDQERYPARLDIAGSILIFLVLATLSLSFNHLHEGGETFQDGWGYHLPMHALTLIFFAALVYVETRSPAPLIDFRIFKNGPFSAAVVANGICHSTMMGTTFLFPFLVQKGLGLGPWDTSFLLMASTLMLTFSGIFGGYLYDRFRSPFMAPIGLGVVAAGLLVMGLFAQVLGYAQFVAIVIVLGVAMGVFFTVNNVMILSSLPNTMRGLASGMEQSSRQLGHTLGITATSAALALSVPREVLETAPPEAWVEGFQRAMVVVAIIAIVGTIISALRRGSAVATVPAKAATSASPVAAGPALTGEYAMRVGNETWTLVSPTTPARTPLGAD